jgi:hypothetical protein
VVLLAIVLGVLAAFLVPMSAAAATITDRPTLFNINGADAEGGPMQGGSSIAVDNSTGALYVSSLGVFTEGKLIGRIYRFHADGTPWPFSATGLQYLKGTPEVRLFRTGLAVDNSGGPNQGRLYVSDSGNDKLLAFDFSGNLLWSKALSAQPGDVGVDPSGHPYVVPSSAVLGSTLQEFASTGSPPAEIGSFPFDEHGTAIDVNAAEELFIGRTSGGLDNPIEKWVGGAFSSTLDPRAADVYIDQSTASGHIFTTAQGHNERQLLAVSASAGQFRLSLAGEETIDLPFDATAAQVAAALESLSSIGPGNVRAFGLPGSIEVEFQNFLAETDIDELLCTDGTVPLSGGTGCDASTSIEGGPSDYQEYAADGTLLETFGENALTRAKGIAYNPSLDRLYVLQLGTVSSEESSPSVAAFGPVQTGTVATPTIDPPSAIGVSSAHFSGTVNPLGTSSQWRFEWRTAGDSWAAADASPSQPLPADSTDHTVEYTTNALRGKTTYQVRLVAVNSANQLAGTSQGRVFTTNEAGQSPVVTIAAPTAVTTNEATISGTVDLQGDTGTWRVQTSTDPACASGFTEGQLHTIGEGSDDPTDVSFQLVELLPAEHYCARIVAANSAGETVSAIEEFETADALPTQVFTAYAAPRTDTTARINGYVNPQGSAAIFRFEFSADGANWLTVPDDVTGEERRQATVSAELHALEPDTMYHYRFIVENDAGVVEGEDRVFRTRTSAAMKLAPRGIELVNQPNKGNQHIYDNPPYSGQSRVTSDGNKAIWTVSGGAPGGNSSVFGTFVATRTASGWQTRSALPPAEDQLGGGSLTYRLNEASPNFDKFLFHVSQSGVQTEGLPTFVTVDEGLNQDVFRSFEVTTVNSGIFGNTESTRDMSTSILFVNPLTRQLEESAGPPEIVSVMPDGAPSQCTLEYEGSSFTGIGTSPRAASQQWRPGYLRMAVTDGSRAYFQSVPNGQPCTKKMGIYSRDRIAEQTTEVDSGAGVVEPAMIRSTPDGRILYFVTAVSHTPDDTNDTGDVYSWSADTDEYTCLTCVVPEAAVEAKSQFSPVMISDDFSHVYFTSKNQLVPGHGEAGHTNLYVLSQGQLRFIADVNHGDSGESVLGKGNAELTPDGATLLFRSISGGFTDLTDDPMVDDCCVEIYRYEEGTESLECVSCQHGEVTRNKVGSASVGKAFALAADGSVAFATKEPLVKNDINNSYDIYQWHDGAVGLITDGETVYLAEALQGAPVVYDVDHNADSIFFVARNPTLTGYEQDGLSNLYVSRVGGGFPRPVAPTHCSEESCQGPLAPSPTQPVPGSSSFVGAGNASLAARKRARCGPKRGKAKRRCLKKRGSRRSIERHSARHHRGGSK